MSSILYKLPSYTTCTSGTVHWHIVIISSALSITSIPDISEIRVLFVKILMGWGAVMLQRWTYIFSLFNSLNYHPTPIIRLVRPSTVDIENGNYVSFIIWEFNEITDYCWNTIFESCFNNWSE